MRWQGRGATAALACALLLVMAPGSSAAGAPVIQRLAPGPQPVLRPPPPDHPDPVAPRRFQTISPAAIPSGTWRPLGPAPVGPPFLAGGAFFGGANSGRITSIVVIPRSAAHAGRIVAGSASGGIWTSDDGGKTWTPRTDSAPDLAIGSLAIDPQNPNHLVAGTGEANVSGDSYPGRGLLVSSNGGTTWTSRDPGQVFAGLDIAQVAIDPNNSQHEFAATTAGPTGFGGGLFETTNGGGSWAKPSDSSYGPFDGPITAVVLDASTTPTTVYMANGSGQVAKSTDGGVTWASSSHGISLQGDFTALALAPSDPSILYASVGSGSSRVALYKTVNHASSWTKVKAPDYTGAAYAFHHGTGEQGNYDNVLAVDPHNATHLLAGGIQLLEKKDGGHTWSSPNGKTNFDARGTNRLHPDNHALFFAPDGSVWIGDDGGVYHYRPATHRVTNANGNLNVTQVRFGFSVVDESVLSGFQDNGSAETSRPVISRWGQISGGDGGPSAITPGDISLQFTSEDGSLDRTTDAWQSFDDITPTKNRPFVPPLLLIPNHSHPASPTLLYGGQDVWRTTNPSAASPTWSRVTSMGFGCQFGGTCVSALAAAPSDPSVVYAGFSDGTVAVSTDGGRTFSRTAPAGSPEPYVTGISLDPSSPRAITVSFSTDTTRTTLALPHVQQYRWSGSPGSGSWTVITGSGLPSAVSKVVYYRGSLVAATDGGVYATGAPSGSSTTWARVGTGLPNVQTQDLYTEAEGLYVATFGRGVWLLPSGAPLNLRLPRISGKAIRGDRLAEHHGKWSGSPTSFAYHWLRCNAFGYSCQAIPGARGRTYVLRQADIGHRIRVQETATNLNGSVTGPTSAPTGLVKEKAPFFVAITHAAVSIHRHSAVLRGVIKTKAAVLTWRFQFGRVRPYAGLTPVRSARPGRRRVSWRLTRLKPHTLYHFRLVVSTRRGVYVRVVTSRGKYLTFRTAG